MQTATEHRSMPWYLEAIGELSVADVPPEQIAADIDVARRIRDTEAELRSIHQGDVMTALRMALGTDERTLQRIRDLLETLGRLQAQLPTS